MHHSTWLSHLPIEFWELLQVQQGWVACDPGQVKLCYQLRQGPAHLVLCKSGPLSCSAPPSSYFCNSFYLSSCIAQAGLQILILLPQFPTKLEYRCWHMSRFSPTFTHKGEQVSKLLVSQFWIKTARTVCPLPGYSRASGVLGSE